MEDTGGGGMTGTYYDTGLGGEEKSLSKLLDDWKITLDRITF